MTRNRAILAATIAAAALLVAGCDSDTPTAPSPEPTATSESPDASPSPTASSVTVKPERPQEMDDDGPAGAEAAAQYFQELDSYIMKTGDTAEWEAMSHKSCETCADRLGQSREIAKNGDTFEGGDATVRVLHTYEQDAATGVWPLDLQIQTEPARITDSNDKEVASFEATDYEVRVEVAQADGQWVVIGVHDLAKE